MSTTMTLAKLRQEQRKIEGLLQELEVQKKEIDEKYASILEEENGVYEEMRKCRDRYQYDRLQMRLNPISRQRKTIETKKQQIERKIRGHKEELKRVEDRIGYMQPRGELVPHKEEQNPAF